MRSLRAAVLSLLAVGALAAPVAVADAATVVVGPADLTSGPTSAGLSCVNLPVGCAWGGSYNVTVGSAAGSLVAPADGVITSWRVLGSVTGGGAVILHVVRPLPGGSFRGIADTQSATALDGVSPNGGGLAQMQPGDMLSITAENLPQSDSGTATVLARAVPGAATGPMGILAAGGTYTPEGSSPNQLLLYNATLDLESPRVLTMAPAAGPASGGTEVAITGAHLAVATGVSFGGVPALSFKGDNGSLTAVAPPHKAGTVDVVVTTAGGGSAPVAASRFTYQPVDDGKKPKLKALGLGPRKFEAANIGGSIIPLAKVGATVKYELSEEATVTFSVARATAGRKAGGKCVKPSGANRGKPRCILFKPLKGSFALPGDVGANSFLFSGRLRGKALAPGRYKLKAVAKDPFGNRSAPKRAPFTIVG